MKKITLKISAFLLFALFALQVQGQACPEVYSEEGSYKIAVCTQNPGTPATELYMTINGATAALEWATLLPDDNPTQVWTIQDHGNPYGTGFVQITADLSSLNAGNWTMIIDQSTIADANDKDFTISVRPGDPIIDNTDENYGFDQFQRRRTSGYGGPGNDALFAKPLGGSGGSRYGVVPGAAGDQVLFDGGGIDGLRFILVETLSLSTEEFDTSSVFISNPVKNELTIDGLNQTIKQISVYSLLGKEVLTRSVDAQTSLSIDVAALTSGMYLVKMQGENGSFTKKIVKQ